jgi:hypothetical protein
VTRGTVGVEDLFSVVNTGGESSWGSETEGKSTGNTKVLGNLLKDEDERSG